MWLSLSGGGQHEKMNYAMQAIGEYKQAEQASALKMRDYKDATDLVVSDREDAAMEQNTIVRRLTPLECERLQGFPDNWTLIGDPEEVEVKDYEYMCTDEVGESEKVYVGSHTEIAYFYTDSDGKRKRVTDSARYKALGNSIGLPYWRVLARRVMALYEHEVTMGSLFDGIGGFPLVFQQCGCTPVWASEIEEFPMAVTKEHFPE